MERGGERWRGGRKSQSATSALKPVGFYGAPSPKTLVLYARRPPSRSLRDSASPKRREGTRRPHCAHHYPKPSTRRPHEAARRRRRLGPADLRLRAGEPDVV